VKVDIPPRRVIPRWRDSSAHLAEPEGLPVGAHDVGATSAPVHWADTAREKLEEWKSDPSPGVTADALSLGVFPDAQAILVPIARAVRESGADIPAAQQSLIRKILGEPEPKHKDLGDSKVAVRLLRQRLRLSLENPIALVDFARHQITLGHARAAERAIRMACAIAPKDRFVLRSASRFFVHQGDAEAALRLLKGSEQVATDPWLLACDMTVASVAGRAPQNVRRARELLRSESLPPEHLTELASAVATLDLDAGRTKEARRLFHQALHRPNDNTVSQVQWAAMETGLPFDAREEWLHGKKFHELRCLRASEIGDFEGVLEHAHPWHVDEPFSSRPMVMSSHVNGLLARFQAAEADARAGLTSNPEDVSLLNNLVYAYAAQDKLEEATITLRRVLQVEKQLPSAHTLANVGCLLIRTGDFERGVAAYRAAMDKMHSREFSARALAFLARELFVQQHPLWVTIKAECEALLAEHESAVARAALRTIDPAVEIPVTRRDKPQKVGRWVYDKAKNLLIISRERLF
jgi:tetratricopeptide (TPR) repeat protein